VVNAAFAGLLHTPAESMVGRELAQFFSSSQRAELTAVIQAVLALDGPAESTLRASGSSGSPQYTPAFVVRRLVDQSRSVVGVSVAAEDDTTGRLASRHVELLRSARSRIGATLDVRRTAEEFVKLAVPAFADYAAVDLLADLTREATGSGAENAELVLERVALKRGAETLSIPAAQLGTGSPHYPGTPYIRALAAGTTAHIPVLESTADWLAHDPDLAATAVDSHVGSLMCVPLRGRGTPLGVVILYRGHAAGQFTVDDVALAEDLAAEAALCLDRACLLARDRRTGLAFRHSLLRDTPLLQTGVETARRYLSGATGLEFSGAWCDVIPLSGSRIALVAGVAKGVGVQAISRAGRARTLVRALASLDPSPEELIAQMDLLVRRSIEALRQVGEDTDLTTTCLYLVFDPVTGTTSAASAGHAAPILIRPGATAEVVELATGPPLGIPGPPAEVFDLNVPEDSVLALHSGGFPQDDVDEGPIVRAALLSALSRPWRSLQDLVDRTAEAVLRHAPPEQDLALLLAKTRKLRADQVATWNLPPDPTVVSGARRLVNAQLDSWGAHDIAPVTELIASELVTNAIRYGQPPIHLRLIRDGRLICEVSDASSTAPHLRHAQVTDEGGRGLFMISQLADAWGTRYTATGKTLWTEQALLRTAQD
jgi:serine phosphatase RsbU (regulator of sigma subunit)